jgi:hypothetical protein
MTEQLPEARPPQTVHPPTEPGAEIARRNTILGLSLFGLVLLIAGGAVLVAFIYLHYD